jgi:hypothetical protein
MFWVTKLENGRGDGLYMGFGWALDGPSPLNMHDVANEMLVSRPPF